MPAFQVFLLESSDLTDISAQPALRTACARLGWSLTGTTFRDADSFLVGMTAATGLPGPVLLVISAHGKGGTGTWLDPDAGAFSVFEVIHLVPPRPENMIVYLSVCWGAYPDLPSALQWRSGTRPPMVVGPLVEIFADDADRFQDALMEVLAAKGANERAIVKLVAEQNAAVAATYSDRPAFGVVLRDGQRLPRWGTNGFGGKRLVDVEYVLVAVQRSATKLAQLRGHVAGTGGNRIMRVVPEDDLPDVAVFRDADGILWLVSITTFCEEAGEGRRLPEIGTRYRFDATTKDRPEHPRRPGLLGGLVDVERIRVVGQSRVRHRFPFALTAPAPIQDVVEVPAVAAGECVRCTSGSLGYVLRQKLPDATTDRERFEREVRVACSRARGTCPIHARLPKGA